MAKTDDERHRYGQHYTPEAVARLLAAFAIRTADDLVFDPSCGDGRLLAAARHAKIALTRGRSRTWGKVVEDCAEPAQQYLPMSRIDDDGLFGIDRSVQAVTHASRICARVAVADFFDVTPGGRCDGSFSLPSQFDAIIGNPPYIRQELLGDDKSRITRLLGQGAKTDTRRGAQKASRVSRNRLPKNNPAALDDEIHFPRWSGRSDIYVYFFAHAAAFLRPGGRLVFLTASSWLDVAYGTQLQEFMLRNFKVVAVVESAVESFFADASVNTSITVLEREPDPGRRGHNPLRFIQFLKPLSDIIPNSTLGTMRLAGQLERGTLPQNEGVMRIRTVGQRDLEGTAGEHSQGNQTRTNRTAGKERIEPQRKKTWGRFLRAEDVFFRIMERAERRLAPLSALASLRFGVKTGANDFFYVKPEARDEAGTTGRDQTAMTSLESLAHVRRGMTTGANNFFYLRSSSEPETTIEDSRRLAVQNGSGDTVDIESKYLHPVVFSLKEIPGIEIKNGRTRVLLFDCADSEELLQGSSAIEYIKTGERAGIHLRPTCSARFPWYSVARGKEPAPLIFPSKIGERWVVAINQAGVYEDKKLYGIFPNPGVPVPVLAALLNSTWARYYSEMTCRQLTGAQAIADIDVAVAGQILLPDPETLGSGEHLRLTAALGVLARRQITSIFEEVERPDRQLLDELVLEAIGFVDERERREVLTDLYRAATDLVRSRLARSQSRIS